MHRPPSVTTAQLLLRPPAPEDVDALFEIQGSAEHMRYTYCAPSREATREYLARHAARFAEDGCAPWTAVLRGEDRVVGWGGLGRDPEQPHWGVEVVYFFHSAYCGRGLATELAIASLEHASNLGMSEVVGFTRPENRASRSVLLRSGFRFVRHVAELERDLYAVDCRGYLAPGAISPFSR